MKLSLKLWLFLWMALPADAQAALDKGAGTSGCVDDTWTAISTVMAPSPRSEYSAVWTGSEMIVWGGGTCGVRELLAPTAPSSPCTYLKTGARYDPTTDSWVTTSVNGAPTARALHTAVWTGTEMIVWGRVNNTGSRYDPQTDSWRLTRIADAPSRRFWHTAVWTGTEMIVWGGGMGDSVYLTNTGGRYLPGKNWTTDTWRPTSTAYAPTARELHTAVWTGSEMIAWGGVDRYYDPARIEHVSVYQNTGSRYCAMQLRDTGFKSSRR